MLLDLLSFLIGFFVGVGYIILDTIFNCAHYYLDKKDEKKTTKKK